MEGGIHFILEIYKSRRKLQATLSAIATALSPRLGPGDMTPSNPLPRHLMQWVEPEPWIQNPRDALMSLATSLA